MDSHFERPKVLITKRVIFTPRRISQSAKITRRMDFAYVNVSAYPGRSHSPVNATQPARTQPARSPKTAQPLRQPAAQPLRQPAAQHHRQPTTSALKRTTSIGVLNSASASSTLSSLESRKQVSFDDDSDSSLTSIDESDDEDSISDNNGEGGSNIVITINKPKGQVGRKQLGYNLQEALGWPTELFMEITAFVQTLAREKLDLSKSYSAQNSSAVKLVCHETAHEYVIIKKYHAFWPVLDMLKLHLKVSSEAARRQQLRDTVDRIQKMAATTNLKLA